MTLMHAALCHSTVKGLPIPDMSYQPAHVKIDVLDSFPATTQTPAYDRGKIAMTHISATHNLATVSNDLTKASIGSLKGL